MQTTAFQGWNVMKGWVRGLDGLYDGTLKSAQDTLAS